MIESLTSLLTERLGAHWRNYAMGSALCFGLAGLAGFLWFTGPEGLTCDTATAHPWCTLAEHGELGTTALLVIAAVAVIAVAGAVAAVAPLVLDRISEPRLPGVVTRLLVRRQVARRDRLYRRTHPQPGAVTMVSSLDQARLLRYPMDGPRPTRAGNALTTARDQIKERYGLDLGLCWTAFVDVLPDPVRARLAEQSTQLLLRAQHVVYVPLTACWAIPIAVLADGPVPRLWIVGTAVLGGGLLEWICLRRLAAAVEDYADLVKATVGTQRRLLYQANGFPLPTGAATEPAEGTALSDYLADLADGPATFRWPTL